jgi:monovalent cation:proton antiporter-2 (CPA2) family protein
VLARQRPCAARRPVRAAPAAMDSLPYVGEALELLAATTIVVPLFRKLRLSPILGFLLAGVVLGPHATGIVKNVEDIGELGELGVLFLLFSMGLELNLDRLRKLRKYAFGMGFLQVTLSATVLGAGAYFMGATAPEAAVIGAALSLSSSAFILQLLAEKGERQSRAGVATFGVLLFQDIAVVPLLVLVPLLGGTGWVSPSELSSVFGAGLRHVLQTLAILNGVVLGGGFVLRRVFSVVADSKSSEAFTSTVLLTVLGTAWLTDELGLSMTLGSFIAGVLLAESSFRSRIMVDTEPFRGLFLGLFFITTGMSMDLSLFVHAPGKMLFLISSLLFWKTAICTLSGLPVGLSLAESLRVGLLIGQGGEFAFVLLAIANKLGFLPDDINTYLVTTVVASMALTPLLYEAGLKLAPIVDKFVENAGGQPTAESVLEDLNNDEPFVLIFGYGPVGSVVGRMLSRKFIRWIAVDISMTRVRSGAAANLPVIYGDSVHPSELLEASGLRTPRAFVITHSTDGVLEECLEAVRLAYPEVPVYVRAKDVDQQKKLLSMGALAQFPETLETSLSLGAAVLKSFGTSRSDVSAIRKELRADGRVGDAFDEYEAYWLPTVNAVADDLVLNASRVDDYAPDDADDEEPASDIREENSSGGENDGGEESGGSGNSSHTGSLAPSPVPIISADKLL